jgi:hypothetical protein
MDEEIDEAFAFLDAKKGVEKPEERDEDIIIRLKYLLARELHIYPHQLGGEDHEHVCTGMCKMLEDTLSCSWICCASQKIHFCGSRCEARVLGDEGLTCPLTGRGLGVIFMSTFNDRDRLRNGKYSGNENYDKTATEQFTLEESAIADQTSTRIWFKGTDQADKRQARMTMKYAQQDDANVIAALEDLGRRIKTDIARDMKLEQGAIKQELQTMSIDTTPVIPTSPNARAKYMFRKKLENAIHRDNPLVFHSSWVSMRKAAPAVPTCIRKSKRTGKWNHPVNGEDTAPKPKKPTLTRAASKKANPNQLTATAVNIITTLLCSELRTQIFQEEYATATRLANEEVRIFMRKQKEEKLGWFATDLIKIGWNERCKRGKFHDLESLDPSIVQGYADKAVNLWVQVIQPRLHKIKDTVSFEDFVVLFLGLLEKGFTYNGEVTIFPEDPFLLRYLPSSKMIHKFNIARYLARSRKHVATILREALGTDPEAALEHIERGY